jgi:hypothetical protein
LEPQREEFKDQCRMCGSAKCHGLTTAHTTPPTTTFLTGITTLEQVVAVAIEAIHAAPYCKSCDCDVSPCDDHKHTPDIIATVHNALLTKLTPLCVKVPTVEEIVTESCRERLAAIEEARKPFFAAIDEALTRKGLDLLTVYKGSMSEPEGDKAMVDYLLRCLAP